MKKSSRKMTFRRETLRIIESPEAALVEGGKYPYVAPLTNFSCTETASFSCGCSIGGCH
jgi:hypothetical protein